METHNTTDTELSALYDRPTESPEEVPSTQATPPPPPDGGWGWLVVLGSFLIHVITDGLVYSFGVVYVEFLHEYGSSKGETSVVAALCMGVSFVVGPIASVLVDRYNSRVTAILGAFIASTGFLVSTWSPSIHFLYITYGLITGFGFGLLLHPAILAVGLYFERRRSLATGLATCGSGVGTFLFPPLVQLLSDTYTWRYASLILSAVILNCAVCGALFRPLKTASNGPKPTDSDNQDQKLSFLADFKHHVKQTTRFRLLKDPSFLLFSVSGTLTSIGYCAPFLFLPHYAQLQGIPGQQASFLISVIGITNIVGRVGGGFIGDWLGQKRLYAFSLATVTNGLCIAMCTLCTTYATMIVYASVFGFTMGAYMAYNWVLLVDLMGLENLSASLGLVMLFDGLTTPIGPPFLGWLLDVTGTYDSSFIVGGAAIMVSGLIVLPIPCIKRASVKDISIDDDTDNDHHSQPA